MSYSPRLKKSRHGWLCYLPNDSYVGRSVENYGEYGEEEVRTLTNLLRPGDVAVDVGANIGALTLPMANAVGDAGRVFAFEPQRPVFQMLCAGLALNGVANVVAEPCALGDRQSYTRLPEIDYGSEHNFGGVSLGNRQGGEFVRVMTLDDYEITRLRLLKVDAEGMEADVIVGAKRTISWLKPALYVENDRPEKSEELVGLIRSLGYDLWWHTPALYNPDNYAGEAENLWPGVASVNMLCLPNGCGAQCELEPVTDPVWRGLRAAA